VAAYKRKLKDLKNLLKDARADQKPNLKQRILDLKAQPKQKKKKTQQTKTQTNKKNKKKKPKK